jgi:hypothetical protein
MLWHPELCFEPLIGIRAAFPSMRLATRGPRGLESEELQRFHFLVFRNREQNIVFIFPTEIYLSESI